MSGLHRVLWCLMMCVMAAAWVLPGIYRCRD